MSANSTQEQIRNYDIFKGIVLLLLVGATVVSIALGGTDSGDVAQAPAGSDASEIAEIDEEMVDEAAAPEFSAPELLSPAPGDELAAGPQTFSGIGNPGSQVAIVAGGQELGRTIVADDGTWQLDVAMLADAEDIELQEMDSSGNVVASSPAIPMTIVDAGEQGDGEEPFTVDPLPEGARTATIVVSGTGEPGSDVAINIGGVQAASTTVNEDGVWSVEIDAGQQAAEVTVSLISPDGESTQEESAGQIPAAEIVAPTIDFPAGALTAGVVTLSGTAQAGSTVQLFANGVSVGTTAVGEDGAWTLDAELAEGDANIDIATLDEAGNIIERIPSLSLPVAEAETPAEGEAEQPAEGGAEQPAEGGAEQPAEGGAQTPEEIAAEIDIVEDADTVVEAIEGSGDFTILLDGLEKAGMEQTLDDVDESYTLFAPTDSAFEAIPQGLLLGWEANPEEYRNLMRFLGVEGKYLPDDLSDGLVLQTVAGTNVGITHVGDLIRFSGVPVVDYAEVGNSVVYAVPQLILPPLPAGVSPPIIDVSGVPVFTGPTLTVVGSAEPGSRVLLTVDGENFGKVSLVEPDGTWLVVGDVEASVRRILAYMLDERGLLQAISPEVELPVPE